MSTDGLRTSPQPEPSSLSAVPTWAERLTRAVRVWKFYDQLPDSARMDRAFKESGVRDLVVENGRLRETLIQCAEMAGEDGEAVAAARSGAMKHPSVQQFAFDAVTQLRADYDEAIRSV